MYLAVAMIYMMCHSLMMMVSLQFCFCFSTYSFVLLYLCNSLCTCFLNSMFEESDLISYKTYGYLHGLIIKKKLSTKL